MDVLFTVGGNGRLCPLRQGRPTLPLNEVDRQQPSLKHRSLLSLTGRFTFSRAEDQSRVHAGKLFYPRAISLALQQVFLSPQLSLQGASHSPNKSCFATSDCKIICSVSGFKCALPTPNKITRRALHTKESQPLKNFTIHFLPS